MSRNDLINKKINTYTILDYLGEGYFGMTYKARDKMGGHVTIKLLKSSRPDWEEEAKKGVSLRDVPEIAAITDMGTDTIELDGEKKTYNYIVSEYVDGISLHSFLKNSSYIPTIFIIDFAIAMCDVIQGMYHHDLEHNDLHGENILLVNPKDWSSNNNLKLKIIDFYTSRPPPNLRVNDMHKLAEHLQECWNINYKFSHNIKVQDKIFQEKLLTLINMMMDKNPERVYDDPESVKNYIKNTMMTPEKNPINRLSHPFDCLSVEQIPENSNLLQELYVDTVPWLKEIESDNTTIISGPRGSGKSMILKNMRLLTKTKSSRPFDQIKQLKYVGFYIHCPHTLNAPFAGLNINYDDVTCNKFIHYFNLLLTSEILESLIELENIKFIDIKNIAKQKLFIFLEESLLTNNVCTLSDTNKLIYYKSLIEKEILYCQKKIQNNEPLSKETPVNFIKNVFNILSSISDFFLDRTIYILLDDYSKSKIPINLQKSLNRMIEYRNDKFYFKITTEKFGITFDVQHGMSLELDREYTYLDLGHRYVTSKNRKERKNFIKEIFNKRLRKNEIITTTIDEYFKPGQHKKIFDQLCDLDHRKIIGKFHYAGFDMIYRLCVGDVSTLLQLCKKIFDTKKTDNDNLDPIPSHIQNDVIRYFSRDRFESIKSIKTHGHNLHKFLEEFGNASQKLLLSTTDASEPNEVIRIELTKYDPNIESTLYEQLIINNIFIDAGNRPPRNTGNIHSIPALILRPIYTPALHISYTNRHAIKCNWSEFDQLLTNPEKLSDIPIFHSKQKSSDHQSALDNYNSQGDDDD